MSPLAASLTQLMAGCEMREWAEILNTNEHIVRGWLKDVALPSPESFRRIIRTALEDTLITDDQIAEFEALTVKPLAEVSPHSVFPERTLASYIGRPIREAFFAVLMTVPPDAQDEVLFEAAAVARRYRDNPRPHLDLRSRRRRLRDLLPEKVQLDKTPTYDPVADEKKLFTLREFEEVSKAALSQYANDFDGANDFTKGKHTYNEWVQTFGRYMS